MIIAPFYFSPTLTVEDLLSGRFIAETITIDLKF